MRSPPLAGRTALAFAAAGLLAIAQPAHSGEQEIEAQRRNAAQLVDTAHLDRIVIAAAQARLPGDAKFQEKVDYFMYRIRPPALWDAKHPAWGPARAALIPIARPETMRQMKEYWTSLEPLLRREAESSFQPGEAVAFLEFALSPGGQAYFDRRLAELRAKNGAALYDLDPASPAELAQHAKQARARFDALPAAEKKRVEAFLAGAQCPACYRPPATAMEKYIEDETTWLTDVLGSQFQSTGTQAVDGWVAAVDAKLNAALPVDSKKQLLGVLEMGRDGALAFRFNFYWHDRADGGTHTLAFPRGSPHYVEVLALAPGLAAGRSRALYRDQRGVIDDKP